MWRAAASPDARENCLWTLVPLKFYFNEKGRAKVELALARSKKSHDKRETQKKRAWERERGRLMRQKG
jgi:SsrA-binding protein